MFIAMLLLSAGFVLYAVEYGWKVNYVAGITAAILVAIGFAMLPEFTLPKPLAASAGLLVGLVGAWLCRTAKRARRNKIHDL